MTNQLTVVFEKHQEWFVAYIREIPGINTQGKSKEEARLNLEDALVQYLEANRNISRREIHGKKDITEEPFAVIEYVLNRRPGV